MKTNINEFYDDIILSDFYEETWNMNNIQVKDSKEGYLKQITDI